MLKKLLFVLAFYIASSCASVKKHNATLGKKYSPEALRADIDFAYKKFQKLQPHLYQYISKPELDRKFDSLKKSISQPMDAKEFYLVLTPVISEIRQGHNISAYPNRRFTKKERKYLKNTKLDFFELDTRYIEDGLWITRTGPKDSTLIGSQIVAVGKETVPQLFQKYRKTFSPDGYNTSFQNSFIANNFTSAYSKDKGYLDSVSLILMHNDSVYVKQFKRQLKDSAGLKQQTIDTTKITQHLSLTSAEKKVKKAKQKKLQKRNKEYGFIANRNRFTRNFKFIDSTSNIGYFKIRGWNNGSSKKFVKESFTKLDSAKTENLIIDLRDNPGGDIEQIADFYSYLTDTDFQFVNPSDVKTRLPNIKNFYGRNSNILSVLIQTTMLPYLVIDDLSRTRKKDGQLKYHLKESKTGKPNPLNFKGKVYVLINGGSFSASSILASQLHGTKRAIFVGEETGGTYNGTVAGLSKVITLPNTKIVTIINLLHIETAQKQEPDGYGIKPDIPVKPTVADFLTGRDTELEVVLDTIKEEN